MQKPSRDRGYAHEYLCRFALIEQGGSSWRGFPARTHLDFIAECIMGVPLPPEVYQFFCHDPPTSLREIAFDALAGQEQECADQIPVTLRAEYRRRRWMQLARQSRCTPEQFADAMMQLLFD